MDVDSGTQAPAKHPLPEIEIFCYLIVLIFLIDQKKYDNVSDKDLCEGIIVFLFCLVVLSASLIFSG